MNTTTRAAIRANPDWYEIVNHNFDNCQYFQGCGTCYTNYQNVVTGTGYNAKEAYEDCVEQIYMIDDCTVVADNLPKRPKGIRKTDHVPAIYCKEEDETYWYVSVRWNNIFTAAKE